MEYRPDQSSLLSPEIFSPTSVPLPHLNIHTSLHIMLNTKPPSLFVSPPPIDSSNLELGLGRRRTSYEDFSRATSPVPSDVGVYVRSRASSPTPEGESWRVSLVLEDKYPEFDYSKFSSDTLRHIKKTEGQEALTMGILPSGFSASTTTLGTSDGHNVIYEFGRGSDDTLAPSGSSSVQVGQGLNQKSSTPSRVQFVAQEDGHGRLPRSKDSDTKSIAPSVRSTSSRLTIKPLDAVRRVFKSASKDDPDSFYIHSPPTPTPSTSTFLTLSHKSRKAPKVYKRLKKGFLKALHGKGADETPFQPYTYVFDPMVDDYRPPRGKPVAESPAPVEKVRSSSSSIFSKRSKRRPTIDSQAASSSASSDIPARTLPTISLPYKRAPSIRSGKSIKTSNSTFRTSSIRAVENKPRLRRPRSFSGYVDYPIVPPQETIEEELDEVTKEATQLATRIGGNTWIHRPLKQLRVVEDRGVNAGFLFERSVEPDDGRSRRRGF